MRCRLPEGGTVVVIAAESLVALVGPYSDRGGSSRRARAGPLPYSRVAGARLPDMTFFFLFRIMSPIVTAFSQVMEP